MFLFPPIFKESEIDLGENFEFTVGTWSCLVMMSGKKMESRETNQNKDI